MQNRTPRQHRYARPASLLPHALAAPLLLLTACTPNNAATNSTPPAATSRPASPQAADTQSEEKLTAQVESALNALTDKGSPLVESGTERVSDGIHSQPTLTPGITYKLTVVCAGSGAAEIEFTPAGAGPRKSVPCDGSAVFERLMAPKELKPEEESVRLDVRGRPGATGMMAWRISRT